MQDKSLNTLCREAVRVIPAYKLVQFMSDDGWSWVQVMGKDPEPGSVLGVLLAALEDIDEDDFRNVLKPYMGEILAETLGAKDVAITWE